MAYSIYHFFADLCEKKREFLSEKKLENFPFDKQILSCVGDGKFPDLAIKLNDGDEMLFVAVLETGTFQDIEIPQFRLNPARGVDIPDLDLGIKAPSQNYATSEPFVSAYERLLGSEYDALIVLTDYQKRKLHPPLKLQVIEWHYFLNTELADFALTAIARKHRDWLIVQSEAWTQKIFRFLAYINQSDWRASRLLRIVDVMQNEEQVQRLV